MGTEQRGEGLAPDYTARPVHDALQNRARFLIQRLSEIGTKLPESMEQIPAIVAEMDKILAELKDLLPWLPLLDGVPKNKAGQKKLVDRRLRELDLPYDFGADAMKAFSRPGAPATSRQPAIRALEMLLVGATWEEIAEEVCEYPGCDHAKTCQKRIRASVYRLNQLLRKHKYDLEWK
jgi:hypothetical protein